MRFVCKLISPPKCQIEVLEVKFSIEITLTMIIYPQKWLIREPIIIPCTQEEIVDAAGRYNNGFRKLPIDVL